MDQYIRKLKEGGYKLTPRRKAMIAFFQGKNAHLTAEEVWEGLKKKFERCGLPSVYRNLEALTECGVLVRIQQRDRKKHYGLCSARKGSHHHHITCIKCGKVEEIGDCAIANKARLKGYKVVSHFMQVNGICSGCSAGKRNRTEV
jgi:Fur family transcriptional regulator, ferric uptake regulator